MKRMPLIVFSLVLLQSIVGWTPADAQGQPILRIDEVQNAGFPDLTLNVSALDAMGYPLQGLASDSFSLSEDGNVVADFQVTPINQHPVQVVLVLDASLSMGYGPQPAPLQNSTAAAQEFLASLGMQDQAGVVVFSDQVAVLEDLTPDLGRAQAALNGLTTHAGTALTDALYRAAGILSGQALRPVVILITDSVDSGVSQASVDDALAALVGLKGVVFPIGWGGARRADLQQLADLTHGEAQFLPGPYPDQTAFRSAFSRIQTLITAYRTQYQLTFTSTLPADGMEHELALALDHLGLHVEETRRFVATQGQIFITFPTLSDGQVVSGEVTFAPQIDTPAALEQLEILVDGQSLKPLVAEPFVLAWDSTQVLPGEHEFRFKARDTAGNLGEAALRLLVQAPITVSISSPRPSAEITSPAVISAEVTAQAKVARVEFRVDGKLLGQVENPPYEMNWPAGSASTGGHEIVVTAYDANGYSAEASIKVNVPESGGNGLGIAIAISLDKVSG